jgi:hypothetical protein
MTLHVVKPTQHQRISASELHALDRKVAVARLKQDLAPRMRWWRIKRSVARLLGL